VFSLSESALDAAGLKDGLRNRAAGACVTFEGWVRDHNEGKQVTRLAYEAYAELADKEGLRILNEAKKKFGLLEARCVHRIGMLDIGDMAVWVGVSAPHRGEAFQACRYIIDEVKHRVPIWKKEFYVDGDSGWVNCERCADHAHGHHAPAITEAQYYERQMRLPQVGESGQQRLRDSRVLIIGAGGLGSPAGMYLATAGVGTIGICEGDRLEASNLHRQPLFGHEDVGKPKVNVAADRLRALNPFIEVHTHETRLEPANAAALFQQYDLILDCTDNFETKFLLNDTALRTNVPVLFASIYQFEGQIQVVDPRNGTPCLRCLWPTMPEPGCVGNCAEVGVLGAVPGVAGSLQAMEALKVLLELPGVLRDEILFCNFLDHVYTRVKASRPAGANGESCAVLHKIDEQIHVGQDDVELSAEVFMGGGADYVLVDIREAQETAAMPLIGMDHITLHGSAIDVEDLPLDRDKRYVFVCVRGMRSRNLANALRRRGYDNVYSLKGGVLALQTALSVRGG